MKVIIAGSRYGWRGSIDDAVAASGFDVTEIVSGGARGVDATGEAWAKEKALPVTRFPALWASEGQAAGPLRNARMAKYADALIALPGGPGTANMVKQAREHGLKVYLHGWTE